jgi:type IV pilus assembly protein PilB
MSTYLYSKFFDYFKKNGLIDESRLKEIEIECLKTDIKPDEYILKKKLANQEDVLKAQAEALGVDYINLTNIAASPQAISLVPQLIAQQYKVFPFEFDIQNNVLKVGMVDPLNLDTLSFLEKKTSKKIIPYLTDPEVLDDVIRIQYQQSLSPTVTNALEEYTDKKKSDKPTSKQKIVKEPPISKLVNTILEFAVKGRASDVHVEPQEFKTRVRYRIDGILYEKLTLPKSLHDSLTSRIKILSQMRIDERRLPQDGRFTFKIGDQEVDLRVSSLPTVHGEKIVMRLLKKTGGIPSLPDLGLSGANLVNLENSINKPYGIVLITGPTGSGKTTTLYSILSRLNKPGVNIMTLEDPVEYELPGINQVQVNSQAGLTFASGLRSFLRQDPNIILVGEIRDKETTTLAVQAALTGHLVFSTLHTNNAATAIPRLIDLGAEPFLIASVLAATVGQRILRKICPSCRTSYKASSEIDKSIRNVLGPLLPKKYENETMDLYKGKGCAECGETGYFGRIGIFEVILTSQEINKLILKNETAEVIEKKAIEQGLITMIQDGFLKVLAGLTTADEVLRVAQE